MDDPIFDPWYQGDDEAPTPTPQRPSRWRSARHSTQGVPASRPVPGALGAPLERSEESDRSEGEVGAPPNPDVDAVVRPTTEVPSGARSTPLAEHVPEDRIVPRANETLVSESAEEPSTADEPTPTSAPHRLAWPDFEARSQPDALDDLLATAPAGSRANAAAPADRDDDAADVPGSPPGTAESLRALLVPRIEALSHRLVVAHHRTALDDRLDESTPILRFLIEPWSGPFDEAEGRDGAVLEIVTTGPGAAWVTGCLWLDPTALAPNEQIEVAAGALTEEWIERLLLDFVEKALSQA